MDYKSLYESIMAIDPKIRFATIFDINGDVIQSGHRGGVKNLLSPEESKKSLQQAIDAWKSRITFAKKIGKGKYVLAVYEKIKRITVPLDDEHLIYITAEVDADHEKIINKTLRLKHDMLHDPQGMP